MTLVWRFRGSARFVVCVCARVPLLSPSAASHLCSLRRSRRLQQLLLSEQIWAIGMWRRLSIHISLSQTNTFLRTVKFSPQRRQQDKSLSDSQVHSIIFPNLLISVWRSLLALFFLFIVLFFNLFLEAFVFFQTDFRQWQISHSMRFTFYNWQCLTLLRNWPLPWHWQHPFGK